MDTRGLWRRPIPRTGMGKGPVSEFDGRANIGCVQSGVRKEKLKAKKLLVFMNKGDHCHLSKHEASSTKSQDDANPRPLATSVFVLALLLAVLTAFRPIEARDAKHIEPERPPLLNSERIERIFGSYGIEVLESDADVRVSNLFSMHQSRNVTRTFAVVRYPDEVLPEFETEHEEILSGGSIGAVFKAHGWRIIKRHEYFGTLEPTADFKGLFHLYGGIEPAELAVHIYSLFVAKGENELHYATIVEVHHPDYLCATDLQNLYPAAYESFRQPSPSAEEALVLLVQKITALKIPADVN